VPDTPFDVIVFDFDGTLVQSAAAKRQAFFDVFPRACAPAVEAVLLADPDGSRYRVIPRMLEEIDHRGLPRPGLDATELVDAYTARAAACVNAAPEMPGASVVLNKLARVTTVYVSSSTPHEQLLRFVSNRGWAAGIAGVFGFPHDKTVTVAALLRKHGIPGCRLLVVGDGSSDATAAADNGCVFHRIETPEDLMMIPALRDDCHV
jgi:phosphoglycolate phosphatase-like HAD superfamily hydrolase